MQSPVSKAVIFGAAWKAYGTYGKEGSVSPTFSGMC